MRRLFLSLTLLLAAVPVRAQLFTFTGANHPELEWHELQTDHFVLVYHQGLDSIVREAAPIAEEVYRVVTTNLQTPLTSKVHIYFSDNDEVRNAFAFLDDYIFVWMRGILDDNLFSLRASGTSKWLRSVLTHEFTHIVIGHATKSWAQFILPIPDVPRWFNEGMARYMEPDGWTNDLDVPLRVSAVSSKLHLGFDDFLAGAMVYEGGQSLVRYIAATYGDTALADIVRYRSGSTYNFDEAVQHATKHSLHEIYDEWHKILNVYYNTEFGQKEDIEDIARKIPTGLNIVAAARLSPAQDQIAVLGKTSYDEPTKLYLFSNDTNGEREILTDEQGIEPWLTWSPDGKYLLFSKIRFGEHTNFVYDLYRLNVVTHDLDRLSSDARLEYPDYSPDGKSIVAVQFRRSGSDLVLLDADGSNIRPLTSFHDDEVEVYSPRWSPNGQRIAFSVFRENGMRDVAVVDVASRALELVTNDSINDRYPVWSPGGDSVLLLSFENGVPNLYATPVNNTSRRDSFRQLTDVASNVLAWDWSKNKDSILVTSFASRNTVDLYWLSATRSVTSAPMPSLAPKYTAWRGVRWPLVTRTPDSIPQTTIVGPYGYNSIAHIAPRVYLPLVGTDMARNGEESWQVGAATILTDEMLKHGIAAFLLYGLESKTFSWEVEYQNNQLPASILVGGGSVLGFNGILDRVTYYQLDRGAHFGIQYTIPAPNSLSTVHQLYIGGELRNLEPWNVSATQAIVPSHRPIDVNLVKLTAKYNFLAQHFQTGINATRSDKKLGSDLDFTRLRAFGDLEISLDERERFQIILRTKGAAQLGAEVPQDFLGFYKYGSLEGGLNAPSFHVRDRLRGLHSTIYGNRLLIGSLEFVQSDWLLSPFIPFLSQFGLQLAEFSDIGSAWYADQPTNNPDAPVTPFARTQWYKTAGAEIRSELAPTTYMSLGVGWELVKNSSGVVYFRVSSDL